MGLEVLPKTGHMGLSEKFTVWGHGTWRVVTGKLLLEPSWAVFGSNIRTGCSPFR